MTALHRVKAYFGMVPADELDSYDGYGDWEHDRDRYDRHPGGAELDRHRGGRGRYESDSFDRYESDPLDRYEAGRYSADRYARREERSRAPWPREPRDVREPRDPAPDGRGDHARLGADSIDRADRDRDRDEESDVSVRSSARGRSWEHNTGPNHVSRSGRPGGLSAVGGGAATSTAGALALEDPPRRPTAVPEPASSSVPSLTPDTAPAPVETPAMPEITTLQPTSYNEARVIGERYRDGIPVIMNLTEMDDAAAKRLVDFAAGLAFALRGSIEKVTNRVFLLSPPHVEVSAADRRKLAESTLSGAGS